MPVKIKVVRTLKIVQKGIYVLRYINMYTGQTLNGVYSRDWQTVLHWINTWDKQYEGLM